MSRMNGKKTHTHTLFVRGCQSDTWSAGQKKIRGTSTKLLKEQKKNTKTKTTKERDNTQSTCQKKIGDRRRALNRERGYNASREHPIPSPLVVWVLYIVLSYHLFWTSELWTHQPGSHKEGGRTGFFHLPSAVLALTFLAKMIQPSLSLVHREVYRILSTLPTN